MLRTTLIRDQVVQVGEPGQKRLLAPDWMMEPFHGEQLPLNGIMRLIKQGAGCWHLRVGEHRIPAGLLVSEPTSHTLAIGHPSLLRHMVSKVAEALTERNHAQTLIRCRTL
jgi:hypothetical protein